MASESAKKVAQKVSASIRDKKIVLKDILLEEGYSESTANSPQRVTNTKSYQDEINPFIEKLKKERDRIVSEMSIKDLDKVQYQYLVSATDTLTKNIQLLSGKETEKTGVTINIVKYGMEKKDSE